MPHRRNTFRCSRVSSTNGGESSFSLNVKDPTLHSIDSTVVNVSSEGNGVEGIFHHQAIEDVNENVLIARTPSK